MAKEETEDCFFCDKEVPLGLLMEAWVTTDDGYASFDEITKFLIILPMQF
jgi:hypothetical protein